MYSHTQDNISLHFLQTLNGKKFFSKRHTYLVPCGVFRSYAFWKRGFFHSKFVEKAMKCYTVYGNTFDFCCILKHIKKIIPPAVNESQKSGPFNPFTMGVFFCTR